MSYTVLVSNLGSWLILVRFQEAVGSWLSSARLLKTSRVQEMIITFVQYHISFTDPDYYSAMAY